MSLLTILQDVADEIGVPRPSSVIGNADETARQLLVCANREGRELAKSADWTVLQRTHSITTVASQEEYDLPDDFARIVPDTEWDEDLDWPMHGPVSMQGWQVLKVSVIGAGLAGTRYRVFRSASGTSRKIFIYPTPMASGVTLSFFYVSDGWCSNSDGSTLQNSWAADTDVLLLDEDLYKLGVIVRYKRSKGLDYASESLECQDMLAREKSQDRPAKTVRLDRRRRTPLLSQSNVPDSGLGG